MSYEQRPRPTTVEIGASLLAAVGLVGAGRVAYGVLTNLSQDDWDAGARAVLAPFPWPAPPSSPPRSAPCSP
uniref:hypothetical protein n=1 Tax=Paractinoplanes polyasparticus TaxID=2856853 RepID=UPI001C859356|nr:hypothetical protein [Actinoplanes polyasparticus]